MLVILNDTLFRATLEPVIPDLYHVEHNVEEDRLELFHNREKVVFGVIWHSWGGKIDPKTGKILAITQREATFRAIFGRNHCDFVLKRP